MPRTTRKPRQSDARAGVAMPYALNLRVTQEQLDAIEALERRTGLHRSDAVRRVIDEWRGRRMEVGTVQAIGFTGVPELGHVEFALVTEVDGVTRRTEFNLDPEHAHELLGDLAAAVEQLESDR